MEIGRNGHDAANLAPLQQRHGIHNPARDADPHLADRIQIALELPRQRTRARNPYDCRRVATIRLLDRHRGFLWLVRHRCRT